MSNIKSKLNYQRAQKTLTLHANPLFNPKWYKTFSLGLFSFLCAYLVASTLTPVQSSDASTVHITNNTTPYYIDITSADDLTLTVEASPTGALASANDTVNIKTNSPSGYKLYVSSSTNDNNIYQGGDSSTSSSGYFYPTTGSAATPVKLTQNTWGFALDKSSGTSYSANFADISNYNTGTSIPTHDSTWAAVPVVANPTPIGENDEDNLSSGGDDYTIYYGVNASTTLPDGSYSTTVKYTAISDGVNKFPTMQDFTSAQCDAMGTNTSINLSDSRDDKYYRVTKMADGHCWMTDNLALDGTDKAGNVRTLTPNDSNVTTNVTLTPNIVNGTATSADVIQIFSGSTNGIVDDSYATTTQTATDGTKMPYGNLYNFMAATAGQGTASFEGGATTSICPKGWSLPQYRTDFSWSNVFGKYNLPTGNGVNANAITAVQTAPFYIPMNGNYVQSTVVKIGLMSGEIANYTSSAANYGRFWMSIQPDSYYNWFIPTSAVEKSNGESVRCIFSGQPDEIMQNFTATQCANLAESTAETDNRKTMIDARDGKFYKISKLADGNCWMVSNLALDGNNGLGAVRTLTPSDSNVTTNRTLATNMNYGTYSLDTPNIYGEDATKTDGQGNTYGNYYNWIAAHANSVTMSTTSTESVCSKGWTIPTNAQYATLLNASGLPPAADGSTEAATRAQKANQAPIHGAYSGYIYGGYNALQNTYGCLIGGPNKDTFTFGFYYSTSSFTVQASMNDANALPVRCIFGS